MNNRFSKCYGFFTLIASKKMNVENKYSSGMRLAVMIVKQKMKEEFGIKSLANLSKKRLKEFETFLAEKL